MSYNIAQIKALANAYTLSWPGVLGKLFIINKLTNQENERCIARW